MNPHYTTVYSSQDTNNPLLPVLHGCSAFVREIWRARDSRSVCMCFYYRGEPTTNLCLTYTIYSIGWDVWSYRGRQKVETYELVWIYESHTNSSHWYISSVRASCIGDNHLGWLNDPKKIIRKVALRTVALPNENKTKKAGMICCWTFFLSWLCTTTVCRSTHPIFVLFCADDGMIKDPCVHVGLRVDHNLNLQIDWNLDIFFKPPFLPSFLPVRMKWQEKMASMFLPLRLKPQPWLKSIRNLKTWR